MSPWTFLVWIVSVVIAVMLLLLVIFVADEMAHRRKLRRREADWLHEADEAGKHEAKLLEDLKKLHEDNMKNRRDL